MSYVISGFDAPVQREPLEELVVFGQVLVFVSSHRHTVQVLRLGD